MGTRAIKKTPWMHTIICRIGPAKKSNWTPSYTPLKNLEEITIPLNTVQAPTKQYAKEIITNKTSQGEVLTMGQRTSTQVDKLAEVFKKGLNIKSPEAQTTTLEALLKDMIEVHERHMTLFNESNAVSAASAKRTSTEKQESNDDEHGQETDNEEEDESPVQRDMGKKKNLKFTIGLYNTTILNMLANDLLYEMPKQKELIITNSGR
ncbi:hypothetical protein SARC_00434 [Sphaeroforma arctica JP610]|uniref:Uncharacterized protein n=1 Tax=Sphaeroforma arctica JP610 TaxID=667725 RepID=A0A0L0GEJ9_9EUKA|nr:hypothetical protein SARC_00434 [Sphaeroforma arctica JP610]KNC87452.1 hypothetical protein SARC_00434 [Sphaeroforma arctica JP610]|eukprot:XP_014161354.1 hypothetical protein SARC_00434 [Sphaeroforma arctica JP610]